MSVYRAEDSSLLGHLDVSDSMNWKTLTLCPQLSKYTGQQSYLTFSGTPNITYTAEIEYDTLDIEMNKGANVTLFNNEVRVFRFVVPQGVSKKQLDVTVTSHSDTPAYLKVSHSCEDVQNDIQYLDYSGASLRLSFGKKGRITLSKASVPPLDNSNQTWFIGIALKEVTTRIGNDNATVIKKVTLILQSSFDYDYRKPMYFLILTAFFGGVVVSLWALFCFREPYVLADEDSTSVSSSQTGVPTIKENIKDLFFSCWRHEADSDEMRPLLRGGSYKTPLSWSELFQAIKKVAFYHWFGRTPKTFSYTTCIVGFILLTGAFQFVFENWHLMIADGDRDKCFYNDFCYRVSDVDIPFNLMISNLAYVIHGLILGCAVWIMEAELLAWCKRLALRNRCGSLPIPEDHERLPQHVMICPNMDPHLPNLSVPHLVASYDQRVELHAQAHKKKFTFSIGYAFSWALIFEGCFSTLYHFCPSKLTFQFDTAFMFVIAGLIVLSLYNGIMYKACSSEKMVEKPVEAANFFLYFIVPLYIFNYFGTLYYAKGLSLLMKTFFAICLAVWYLVIFSWAGFKLFYKIPFRNYLHDCNALTKAIIFTVVLITACIGLPVLYETDFPDIFLFTCIVASLFAIIGKVLIQFWNSEQSHWTFKRVAFRICQGSYVLMTFGIMGTAIWFFTAKATTNKIESPEKSRDLNHDCVLLNFFDYHDIWHIMSSFSLLMGAYLVLYISG